MFNTREVRLLNDFHECESAGFCQSVVDGTKFIAEERHRPPIANNVMHGDSQDVLLQVRV